jgi:hypothetical protein
MLGQLHAHIMKMPSMDVRMRHTTSHMACDVIGKCAWERSAIYAIDIQRRPLLAARRVMCVIVLYMLCYVLRIMFFVLGTMRF